MQFGLDRRAAHSPPPPPPLAAIADRKRKRDPSRALLLIANRVHGPVPFFNRFPLAGSPYRTLILPASVSRY